MPEFKYVGDDDREIDQACVVVKPGDTFEVSDEIAAGFEGQDIYEKVKGKSSAPSAPKESGN